MDELFPPVRLISPLEAWDDPSYIPRSPHNLPLPGQRPSYVPGPPNVAPLMPAIISPSEAPSQGPLSVKGATTVRDPHRYAKLIELNFNVPTTSDNSGLFLSEPVGLRNMLMIRNTSVTANILVSFGTFASASSIIRLTPNTIVLWDTVVPQNDIYAFADAASGSIAFAYSTIAG